MKAILKTNYTLLIIILLSFGFVRPAFAAFPIKTAEPQILFTEETKAPAAKNEAPEKPVKTRAGYPGVVSLSAAAGALVTIALVPESLIVWFFGVFFFTAIIFGIIGLSGKRKNKGKAKAGLLITGIYTAILAVIIAINTNATNP